MKHKTLSSCLVRNSLTSWTEETEPLRHTLLKDRPVRQNLEPFAKLRIVEYVDLGEFGFDGTEYRNSLRGKTGLGKIQCAYYIEKHWRALKLRLHSRFDLRVLSIPAADAIRERNPQRMRDR